MFNRNKNKKVYVEPVDDKVYIILGEGYSHYVYNSLVPLKELIKSSRQIKFIRQIDKSKLEYSLRKSSNEANYFYDYDWWKSFNCHAVTFERAYVPFDNKEDLEKFFSEMPINDVIDYNTARKIYADLIDNIKELDKMKEYNTISKSVDVPTETIPGELEPSIWKPIGKEDVNNIIPYVFCTCNKIPKNTFYYLNDTPCNEIDNIDASIFIQGLYDFDTVTVNDLCDFKQEINKMLSVREDTINRAKSLFNNVDFKED